MTQAETKFLLLSYPVHTGLIEYLDWKHWLFYWCLFFKKMDLKQWIGLKAVTFCWNFNCPTEKADMVTLLKCRSRERKSSRWRCCHRSSSKVLPGLLLLWRVLEGVRSQARRTGHLVIRCSLFRKTLTNHSSASEGGTHLSDDASMSSNHSLCF